MLKPLKKWFLKRLVDVFDNHYQRLDSPALFRAVDFVNCVSDDTMLRSIINGVPLLMPASYLQMFPHCHHAERKHPLTYEIERRHCDWMTGKLSPGSVAVDIGASAGTITAAMSKTVGRDGTVFAFEPARRAYSILEKVVTANELTNVTYEQIAVCDNNGTALFAEYGADPTGENTWLPEASTLMTDAARNVSHSTHYEVRTVRLDDYLADFSQSIRLIKIDVEGFEIEVLKGAGLTIQKHHPFFSIDIHKHPTADGDTEPEVKSILGSFGYRFDRLGHVLVASMA